MKILVTGNLGYVGTAFTGFLAKWRPSLEILGLDSGFFQTDLVSSHPTETNVVRQIFGDIRDVRVEEFDDVDAVVHLAAISNDPMGNLDEQLTFDVNTSGTLRIAKLCEQAGVRHMVFASSCSVYGRSGNSLRAEGDETGPLTTYAKSKVLAEEGLAELAGEHLAIDCLRFATAAGWSPNLRSDLVVNDLTLGALRHGRLVLKSDGLAWRPIIDVEDMARAIAWALEDENREDAFRLLNVGSVLETYSVKQIAEMISVVIPGAELEVGPDSFGDNRSYRVDFSKFASLAPDSQPQRTLRSIVEGLVAHWAKVESLEPGQLVRLNVLTKLLDEGQVDGELRWISRGSGKKNA